MLKGSLGNMPIARLCRGVNSHFALKIKLLGETKCMLVQREVAEFSQTNKKRLIRTDSRLGKIINRFKRENNTA